MKQTIHGRTIKQIFKSQNEWNNTRLLLGAEEWQLGELSVYIDDERVYRGTDYKQFVKYIRKEYIKSFYETVENLLMGAWYNTFDDEFGHQHVLQIMVD